MRLETVREQDAYDEGFANGKDYWLPLEQDRIIKLLEDDLATHYKDWSDEMECGLQRAIALIKGEEK